MAGNNNNHPHNLASPLVLLLLHLFFREVFILLEYCPSLPSRHYLCHSVFIIIIILIIIMIRVLAICLSVSLLGLVTVGSGHHLPVKKTELSPRFYHY